MSSKKNIKTALLVGLVATLAGTQVTSGRIFDRLLNLQDKIDRFARKATQDAGDYINEMRKIMSKKNQEKVDKKAKNEFESLKDKTTEQINSVFMQTINKLNAIIGMSNDLKGLVSNNWASSSGVNNITTITVK